MIEPQNDEERKALRLAKVMYDAEGIDEHDIRLFMHVLAEARAIFREEQAKGTKPTPDLLVKVQDYIADAVEGDVTSKWMAKEVIDLVFLNLPPNPHYNDDDKAKELARVREEIRLRSEVLRAFDAAFEVGAWPDAFHEYDGTRQRLLWLLKRERELMGEEWTT